MRVSGAPCSRAVCACAGCGTLNSLCICVFEPLLLVHYKSAQSVVDALWGCCQNRPAHALAARTRFVVGHAPPRLQHQFRAQQNPSQRWSPCTAVLHAGEGWSVLAAHLLATLLLPCAVIVPKWLV